MQPNHQLPQYRTLRKGIKLDMIKCRFCRDAKQKCDSKGRQWPGQKCTRCLDKNLQCSEGQRAKRMVRTQSSPQSTEIFVEPKFRAVVLASKSIAGKAQPLRVIDIPLNIENTNRFYVPTEERSIRLKESLILLSIHTVLMLALQELKTLGDQMWSISCNDPYHRTPASGLPGLENIFLSFKSFACDLTTRVLRIGAGEKLISVAYAALETDYSQRKITWSENDAPRHLEGSIAQFQELGHHGFAHVLHMKRLLDRPKLTDHEAQLLVHTRHGFLTEVRETLYKYSIQEPVPASLYNTQIFIPSRFLKHLTIMENVQGLGIPDCLGRSVSHILSDAGRDVDWSTNDVHHVDALGRSGLYISCQNGDEVRVKEFIAKGANVYQPAMNGLTPMHIAACMGHTTIFTILWNTRNGREETLRSCGDLRDRSGRHPLLWAALWGRHETVVRFFELCFKLDLNPTLDMDDFGCTAVTLAACGGHDKLVQFLVNNYFPADVQDSNGRTAFWYAAQGGHEATMKFLSEHATVDHRDKYGQTPLAEAARQGQTNALNYLLSLNQYTKLFGVPILVRVDPDSRDNAGKSALVHAAENGHSRCVRSLLDQAHDTFYPGASQSHIQDMLIVSRIARERQDWSTLRALSRGTGKY